MPNLICGNCGYPSQDPAGCALCQGPVFDLSTPRGVIDCRTYRSMRNDRAQTLSTEYFGLFVTLGVLAMGFALIYAGEEVLAEFMWPVISLLPFVGGGLVYWYHRWTRLSKECVLDARLGRPDPFHDPGVKEPPRARLTV